MLVPVLVVVVVVLLKVPKPTVEPRVEKLIGDYLFGGDHTFRRPNPRLPRFAQWPEGGRDAREIWIWLKVMMVLNWICGSTIGFFVFFYGLIKVWLISTPRFTVRCWFAISLAGSRPQALLLRCSLTAVQSADGHLCALCSALWASPLLLCGVQQ